MEKIRNEKEFEASVWKLPKIRPLNKKIYVCNGHITYFATGPLVPSYATVWSVILNMF
jgi:hypothetical protein